MYMYMWSSYNSQINFYHFFLDLNLNFFFRPRYYQSVQVVGTLYLQLLQVYANLFETVQVFSSLSEDVHVIWI